VCEATLEGAAWVPSVEQNVARFDDPMLAVAGEPPGARWFEAIVYESCLTLSLRFPIGAVGVITVTL
jgi:hypothetical protein